MTDASHKKRPLCYSMYCVLVPHRPAIEEVGAGGEEEEEEVGREGLDVTEMSETAARDRWVTTCTM